jgi:uncharacterized protein
VTSEPDMDHLLASIRKAINIDMGEHALAPSIAYEKPFRGSMREMRARYEIGPTKDTNPKAEIAELRNKINRSRTAESIFDPVQQHANNSYPSSSRTGFAAILAGDLAAKEEIYRAEPVADPPYLRPSVADGEDSSQHYEEPEAHQTYQTWGEAEQSYLPVVQENVEYHAYPEQGLMSDDASTAANDSFNQLADTLMARAMGERSIEDVTQELLRGMLKSWLDANLPSLVERLVREEIERVARRGR